MYTFMVQRNICLTVFFFILIIYFLFNFILIPMSKFFVIKLFLEYKSNNNDPIEFENFFEGK